MKQNKIFFADFEIYASTFYGTLWEKNWVDIVVSNANKKDVKKNYMHLRLPVNDFVGVMNDFGEEMEGKEGCRCAEFKQGDNLIGVAVTNGMKHACAVTDSPITCVDKTGRVYMKLTPDGDDYIDIALSVAEKFVPNPDKLKYVIHKDGDKNNNKADNLLWSDKKEK